jgi:hypothetical protein
MFRITQPSEQAKPEYYWTADYFEAHKGLQQEVSGEKRRRAVILIADLKMISQNGGLIQDVNDSGSLDVRQIGTGSFDQKKALVITKPNI